MTEPNAAEGERQYAADELWKDKHGSLWQGDTLMVSRHKDSLARWQAIQAEREGGGHD